MNFLLDNNLPPAFAKAIHALAEKEGHQVVHLTDKFPRNAADIEWVGTLHEEGGWVIVSQDQFRKSDLEKKAFRECGLVVFCLAKQWSKEAYWKKAHNLVRWWPAVMEQAERVSGGAAFRVPWSFTTPGKFQQVKL